MKATVRAFAVGFLLALLLAPFETVVVDGQQARLASTPQTPSAPQVIPFREAGRWQGNVGVVVAPNATDEQLVALISALRKARMDGTLSPKIAPTTPGGQRGSFGYLLVFVFSDTKWATSKMIQAFMNEEPAIEKDFGAHVLASYYYTEGASAANKQDTGSIGLEMLGRRFTTKYRRLF